MNKHTMKDIRKAHADDARYYRHKHETVNNKQCNKHRGMLIKKHDQLAKELREWRSSYNTLRYKFEHTHVNNGVDDSCKECGLDLRNPIHRTLDTV